MKDRLEGGCGRVEEGYGPRPIGGEVLCKGWQGGCSIREWYQPRIEHESKREVGR